MLAWFDVLRPKQDRLRTLFDAHAALLVAAASGLADLAEGSSDRYANITESRRRVEEAMRIMRAALRDARRMFLTPFDRDTVAGMMRLMDEAIDQMSRTAKTIDLYEVTNFEPATPQIARLCVEAAQITAQAVPLLWSVSSHRTQLKMQMTRIIGMIGDSDNLREAGLKAVLTRSNIDPLAFMSAHEIFDRLERVMDCFAHIASAIQRLIDDID